MYALSDIESFFTSNRIQIVAFEGDIDPLSAAMYTLYEPGQTYPGDYFGTDKRNFYLFNRLRHVKRRATRDNDL